MQGASFLSRETIDRSRSFWVLGRCCHRGPNGSAERRMIVREQGNLPLMSPWAQRAAMAPQWQQRPRRISRSRKSLACDAAVAAMIGALAASSAVRGQSFGTGGTISNSTDVDENDDSDYFQLVDADAFAACLETMQSLATIESSSRQTLSYDNYVRAVTSISTELLSNSVAGGDEAPLVCLPPGVQEQTQLQALIAPLTSRSQFRQFSCLCQKYEPIVDDRVTCCVPSTSLSIPQGVMVAPGTSYYPAIYDNNVCGTIVNTLRYEIFPCTTAPSAAPSVVRLTVSPTVMPTSAVPSPVPTANIVQATVSPSPPLEEPTQSPTDTLTTDPTLPRAATPEPTLEPTRSADLDNPDLVPSNNSTANHTDSDGGGTEGESTDRGDVPSGVDNDREQLLKATVIPLGTLLLLFGMFYMFLFCGRERSTTNTATNPGGGDATTRRGTKGLSSSNRNRGNVSKGNDNNSVDTADLEGGTIFSSETERSGEDPPSPGKMSQLLDSLNLVHDDDMDNAGIIGRVDRGVEALGSMAAVTPDENGDEQSRDVEGSPEWSEVVNGLPFRATTRGHADATDDSRSLSSLEVFDDNASEDGSLNDSNHHPRALLASLDADPSLRDSRTGNQLYRKIRLSPVNTEELLNSSPRSSSTDDSPDQRQESNIPFRPIVVNYADIVGLDDNDDISRSPRSPYSTPERSFYSAQNGSTSLISGDVPSFDSDDTATTTSEERNEFVHSLGGVYHV
jgi:hypothetical protein